MRLGGADDGVVRAFVMLRCVLVLGRVTAADVAAFEAGPEVHPGVSHRNALRTHMRLGGNVFGVSEVVAEGHRGLLLFCGEELCQLSQYLHVFGDSKSDAIKLDAYEVDATLRIS
jgi:hypothetical protein